MIDTVVDLVVGAFHLGWQLYLFAMFLLLVSALGKYAFGWITGKYR